MRTAIHSDYDPDIIRELGTLIDGSYEHLPDGDQHFENKNLYEDVKIKIKEYEQYKDSLSR